MTHSGTTIEKLTQLIYSNKVSKYHYHSKPKDSISVDRRKGIFRMSVPPRSVYFSMPCKTPSLARECNEVYPREASMFHGILPYREKQRRDTIAARNPVFLVPKFEEKCRANQFWPLVKLTSDAGTLRASAKEHHRNDACRRYRKNGEGRRNDIRWSERRREKTMAESATSQGSLLPWKADRGGEMR
jgi:hypothetical protein